ncbi:MAG: hypothetical protein ACE14S_07260 [Candidatus Bathyarchaeia archaeon]
MGYRPQVRTRRENRGLQKSPHEKAKAKRQKHPANGRYAPEEEPPASVEETAEKTLTRLEKLGNQTFALSPFSQYFDDWLLNLRQVLAEFEATPGVTADEGFVKARTQVFTDVERELAQRRITEAALVESAKALSDANHKLVDIDANYAAQTREFSAKRNAEVERLTKAVHDLEEEVERISQTKTSFFGLTKKAKEKKAADAAQRLNSAKAQLEVVLQNFTVEQEKLHDEYEKKKQAVMEQVRQLEKELEQLETDSSLEARRKACGALAEAVKGLLQRRTVAAQ